MLRGVDVSAYQGRSIQWDKVVADGIAYVYVKASEGATGGQPTFAVDVAGAKAAGLLVGAYHFAHQGNVSAQVANFRACSGLLGSNPGELPPMLDVERSPSPPDFLTSSQLLDAIESTWGCVPLVYGGNDYLAKLGLDAHCPLMLAAYPPELQKTWPGDATVVSTLPPWGKPAFWQFSDKCYDLSGAGPCDSSVFLGTMDELKALCARSLV